MRYHCKFLNGPFNLSVLLYTNSIASVCFITRLSVQDTFKMLYEVLSVGNQAYVSGDIEQAYKVLSDALRLFKRLENEKAIGVVCNNLGAIMHAIYKKIADSNKLVMCGMSKREVVSKGISYFRTSIKLGEELYDKFYEEQGWSPECLAFMQNLSSRYFNRAMFLLTVKNDHTEPIDAEQLGFRDIQITKDMDVEVVGMFPFCMDQSKFKPPPHQISPKFPSSAFSCNFADQFVDIGFLADKVKHYDLTISRINGYLTLMEMSYPDIWEVGEKIHTASNELKAAMKTSSVGLFDEMTPAGRMQQLELQLIRYAKVRGDVSEAAKIGIRMLVEDEYISDVAELKAVESLIDYLKLAGSQISQNTANELKDKLNVHSEGVDQEMLKSAIGKHLLKESGSMHLSIISAIGPICHGLETF